MCDCFSPDKGEGRSVTSLGRNLRHSRRVRCHRGSDGCRTCVSRRAPANRARRKKFAAAKLPTAEKNQLIVVKHLRIIDIDRLFTGFLMEVVLQLIASAARALVSLIPVGIRRLRFPFFARLSPA